jgi:hypothetical protein
VPEQYQDEWRHESKPRQDETGARGRDAAHQAKDDGCQNPRSGQGGFRIFELHDAILRRAPAWALFRSAHPRAYDCFLIPAATQSQAPVRHAKAMKAGTTASDSRSAANRRLVGSAASVLARA